MAKLELFNHTKSAPKSVLEPFSGALRSRLRLFITEIKCNAGY